MKRFIAATLLATAAFSAFALPTVDEVQVELGKGNYAQAEQMMREVVAAKPGSARAHYVYAEILAHDKRFDLAAKEVARAREIDPALKFTQPDKFTAFEKLLEREQTAARRAVPATRADEIVSPVTRATAPAPSGGGLPGWIWGLGIAAIAVLAWRMLAARRQTAGPSMAAGSGMTGAPVPGVAGAQGGVGGYGSGGFGPGSGPAAPGRGMLGTGLAVAGGLAAGALAEKWMEGHRGGDSDRSAASSTGGLIPGSFDGTSGADAERPLEERDVDLGSGNDWDSGDSGGTSSGDGGW